MRMEKYDEAKHYDMLCEWWKDRHPIIDKDYLPETGFLACDGDKPIMMAWVVLTNAKFCYFKGVTSNPDSTWEQRETALLWLADLAALFAKDLGYKRMISVPIKPRLAEKFSKAGFEFYPQLVHMCEREI